MTDVAVEVRELRSQVSELTKQISRLAAVVNRGRIKYTVAEAAERLKKGESTVWALLSSGELESVKEGGRRYVTEEACQMYEHRARVPMN